MIFRHFSSHNYLSRVLFLIAFIGIGFSQFGCELIQPCTVTLEHSPDLRGIRLGMNVEQLQAITKTSISPEANQSGLAILVIEGRFYRESSLKESTQVDGENLRYTFVDLSKHPSFIDVERIYVYLVEGTVAKIQAFYNNDWKRKSSAEFAKHTGDSLKLDGRWQERGKGDYSLMDCSDFNVYAGIRHDYNQESALEKEALPFVELANLDLSLKPVMKDYRKKVDEQKIEDQKRDAFKP